MWKSTKITTLSTLCIIWFSSEVISQSPDANSGIAETGRPRHSIWQSLPDQANQKQQRAKFSWDVLNSSSVQAANHTEGPLIIDFPQWDSEASDQVVPVEPILETDQSESTIQALTAISESVTGNNPETASMAELVEIPEQEKVDESTAVQSPPAPALSSLTLRPIKRAASTDEAAPQLDRALPMHEREIQLRNIQLRTWNPVPVEAAAQIPQQASEEEELEFRPQEAMVSSDEVYSLSDIDSAAVQSSEYQRSQDAYTSGLSLQAVLPVAAQAADARFSVEEIKAPLPEATTLFSKLGIQDRFRDQPLTMASPVRGFMDDPNFDNLIWPHETFTWVTAAFHYQPLYFEQVNLERYGYGPRPCCKPILSSAHFFGSIALMPYKLITQHPCEHVYTLGHQRPGDCVRYQRRSLLGQSYPGEALAYCYSYQGYR